MKPTSEHGDEDFPEWSADHLGDSGQRRKAGRPRGALGAVLTDLSDRVTMEDFAYVRALLNGIEPARAFRQYYEYRYFDTAGAGIIPHGLSLAAHGRSLMATIMKSALQSGDELIQMMAQRLQHHHAQRVDEAKRQGRPLPARPGVPERKVPSLEEWMESENIDPDFYAEVELIGLYEEYLAEYRKENSIESTASGSDAAEKRAAIEAQIQAVNLLQNRLTSSPAPSHPVQSWIERSIAEQMIDQGVETLGDLVGFIGAIGRPWPKRFKGLGPVRAERLMAWLDVNQGTLGNIVRDGPQWQKRGPLTSRLAPLVRPDCTVDGSTPLLSTDDAGALVPVATKFPALREGIAPLELVAVPPHLDGTAGLYRAAGVNHFGARTDMQAIRTWLGSYLHAGKHSTFDAYRREIERFYLWCLNEARVPLSSVSLAHALGYQQFLASIPAKYITTDRVTRADPRWRPFRGQLDPKSQVYAIGVVGQFFATAHANGYLTGNPFASVKSAAVTNRDLDTSRSLSLQDLEWLRKALADHVAESSSQERTTAFDFDSALRRRLSLIFHIGLSSGLRRSEITTSSIASMQPAMVNGVAVPDYWMLEVIGKGSKVRTVPISDELRSKITSHHEDVRRMLREVGESSQVRLRAFERRPPLVCALRAPVGHVTAAIDDDAAMANDNLALGKVGLYRVIRSFFVGAARPHIKACEKRLAELEGKSKVAEAKGDGPGAAALLESKKEVRRELATWLRRSSMTTHWMRHTFAIGILRDNPNDAGLKLAQQLLGHASIATTQIYLKVDDTEKTKAVHNHKPFGS